jgi:C4-type Zn-finger protein
MKKTPHEIECPHCKEKFTVIVEEVDTPNPNHLMPLTKDDQRQMELLKLVPWV